MNTSAYKEAFVTEAGELLQTLNDSLIGLEQEPAERAHIEEIFRAAHSLKGMSATMGYKNLADLTHHMETVLDLVRQGQQPVTDQLTAIVFECLDTLEEMVEAVNAGEPEDDAAALIERLTDFAGGARNEAAADPTTSPAPAPSPATDKSLFRVSVALVENCVLKSVRAYMVVKRLDHIGEIQKSNPSLKDIEDEKFDNQFELEVSSSSSAEKIKADVEAVSEIAGVEVVQIKTPAQTKAKTKAKTPISTSESQTVRISITHLDNLVNLVGELVINRSRLEKLSETIKDLELDNALHELRRLTGDLQYEVMQTRMVPVGNIFSRFPRMVRDVAKELSKKIDFVVEGSDIELDRTVLDEIGDPIVHLLRNAVGHGIESSEEREAAGKPESGKVKLSAAREKDTVVIEVSDDGGGLDSEKLRKKAVKMGLFTEEEAKKLPSSEVFDLIYRSGLTTAQTVGPISGRGVGMDAVKGKIEALGGTVSISSNVGKGTTFTLELPLTLAIIQALMVGAAGRTYALPLSNVVEVSSVDRRAVKWVKNEQVIMVRDKIVPLMWLSEKMGLNDHCSDLTGDCQIAVVRRGRELRALVVGELLGRSEIVVKPLTKFFGAQPGVGGVTVLGDGRLALVLDVRTLN